MKHRHEWPGQAEPTACGTQGRDLKDREIRKTHWASKLVLFFPMNSRTIY